MQSGGPQQENSMTNPKQELPTSIKIDLHQLVEYLWEDESNHFHSLPDSDREDHVFLALQNVRLWLNTDESQ